MEEAGHLLVLACSTNLDGEFIARELVEAQTINNLMAFGMRLQALYDRYIAKP